MSLLCLVDDDTIHSLEGGLKIQSSLAGLEVTDCGNQAYLTQ